MACSSSSTTELHPFRYLLMDPLKSRSQSRFGLIKDFKRIDRPAIWTWRMEKEMASIIVNHGVEQLGEILPIAVSLTSNRDNEL